MSNIKNLNDYFLKLKNELLKFELFLEDWDDILEENERNVLLIYKNNLTCEIYKTHFNLIMNIGLINYKN